MRRTAIRAAALLALSVALAGCGGGGDDEEPAEGPEVSACEEAFAEAAEVDDMSDVHEDLWPAFEACGDLDEFSAAAEKYPDAINGTDPETYAKNGCLYEESLAESPVCVDISG
jgi:hypothetical protein